MEVEGKEGGRKGEGRGVKGGRGRREGRGRKEEERNEGM